MRLFYVCSLLTVLLVSCGKNNTTTEMVKVAALKGPSAMSMIGLIDKGYQDDKLKASFTIYNEPAQVEALMIHGDADIALIPGNMAAVFYNRKIPYHLLAVPVWGTLYLAGIESTITDWNSLKGKTVYLMARGATPDIIFRRLLKFHALEPDKDVKLNYTFPNHLELFTAITAGRADLGVLAEPFLSQAESLNPRIRMSLNLEKEWNKAFQDSVPMMQTAVMVSDSFARIHPEWICRFSKAYGREVDWLHQRVDSAAALCVKYQIIKDEKVAFRALLNANIRYEEASTARDGIYHYFQSLYEFNPASIGGEVPPVEMIFNCSEVQK